MKSYKEFTKISIHNHFGGDNADRLITQSNVLEFDTPMAISQIDDAANNEFNLIAMTNSNVFHVERYIILNRYAKKKGVTLIPGVELNVCNSTEDKFLHVVILISDNDDIFLFKNMINEMIGENSDIYINFTQLAKLVYNFKAIIIPHGLKQNERSSGNNVEQLKKIISMDFAEPILLEDNKAYQKVTLKSKLEDKLTEKEYIWLAKVPSVSALDRIASFSNIQSPTYIWGDKDYDSLYYSALMGETRVFREEDLNTKPNYVAEITIEPSGEEFGDSTVKCSHGLNSIIGSSGSGKTLLLNWLSKYFSGKNLEHSASSERCDYERFYDQANLILKDYEGSIIHPDDFGIFEGENLYKQIITAFSKGKDEIIEALDAKPNYSNYYLLIDEFNRSADSYISNNLRINESNEVVDESISIVQSAIEFIEKNQQGKENIDFEKDSGFIRIIKDNKVILTELRNDEKSIVQLKKDFIKLLNKYDIDKNLHILEETFKLLNKQNRLRILQSENKIISAQTNVNIIDEIDRIVTDYNKIIGSRFSAITRNRKTISEKIELIIDKLKDVILISNSIIVPTINKEKIKKSVIVNKKGIRLNISGVNTTINYDNVSKIFDNSVGVSAKKLNKTLFKELLQKNQLIDLSAEEDVDELLSIFIDNNYRSQSYFNPSVNDLMEYEVQIKNNIEIYQSMNTLSAGEISKIYINRMIDEKLEKLGNNCIILYDQPDSNLEKRFVLDTLVDKITKLKYKYQIFITTHEPLLVVNADTNSIIVATNEKKIEKNNFIKYRNLSFINKSNKKEVVKEISSLIDGSFDAVKLRTKVYGGMMNEN